MRRSCAGLSRRNINPPRATQSDCGNGNVAVAGRCSKAFNEYTPSRADYLSSCEDGIGIVNIVYLYDCDADELLSEELIQWSHGSYCSTHVSPFHPPSPGVLPMS